MGSWARPLLKAKHLSMEENCSGYSRASRAFVVAALKRCSTLADAWLPGDTSRCIASRSTLRTIRLCGTTSTKRYERIVPAITPTEPMRWTSTIESARFNAAAKIESTPCSRVRFTAASRHDSTVMNPLIKAHNDIVASSVDDGTAAGPAH